MNKDASQDLVQYCIHVEVALRDGIADPEGQTIQQALLSLGFVEVTEVRVAKNLRLTIQAANAASALQQVEAMCERLLTNPVIEEAFIQVVDSRGEQ
ncbi:MAG: phosphoribosylformylglycinamidine synthase subunit PurS [bacterium]|nr:phosphoribosylformylglycinamidine synthase subunit PurS [bacterium]MCY4258625.1 phosphoribosylformylglycinamidine synthase subunit PurS [bacterium]